MTSTGARVEKLDLFLTRCHYSHVLVSRGQGTTSLPWAWRTCTGRLYRQASGKIALCLKKPGRAKDLSQVNLG